MLMCSCAKWFFHAEGRKKASFPQNSEGYQKDKSVSPKNLNNSSRLRERGKASFPYFTPILSPIKLNDINNLGQKMDKGERFPKTHTQKYDPKLDPKKRIFPCIDTLSPLYILTIHIFNIITYFRGTNWGKMGERKCVKFFEKCT